MWACSDSRPGFRASSVLDGGIERGLPCSMTVRTKPTLSPCRGSTRKPCQHPPAAAHPSPGALISSPCSHGPLPSLSQVTLRAAPPQPPLRRCSRVVFLVHSSIGSLRHTASSSKPASPRTRRLWAGSVCRNRPTSRSPCAHSPVAPARSQAQGSPSWAPDPRGIESLHRLIVPLPHNHHSLPWMSSLPHTRPSTRRALSTCA